MRRGFVFLDRDVMRASRSALPPPVFCLSRPPTLPADQLRARTRQLKKDQRKAKNRLPLSAEVSLRPHAATERTTKEFVATLFKGRAPTTARRAQPSLRRS